jgi:hypothetical protein
LSLGTFPLIPTDRAPRKFSGIRTSRYALVRRCMQAYLSPILVDSILTKAMDAAGASDRSQTEELLPKIVEHSLSGLKLFVEPDRLSELMARLRVLVGTPEAGLAKAASDALSAKRNAG